MIFERYDVVVVPFPFTDKSASKRRPAVVLSDATALNRPSGHAVMAMVTSATDHAWPHDVPITDLAVAGLTVPCALRFKLFTLDTRLVIRKAGALGAKDRKAVASALRAILID